MVIIGAVVSAVIVLVVAAVTVGEFAEVTMPAAGKVTVMLSAGDASDHVLEVARVTKNFVSVAPIVLFAPVVTTVLEPMFTVV